jgi:hypothetical protein
MINSRNTLCGGYMKILAVKRLKTDVCHLSRVVALSISLTLLLPIAITAAPFSAAQDETSMLFEGEGRSGTTRADAPKVVIRNWENIIFWDNHPSEGEKTYITVFMHNDGTATAYSATAYFYDGSTFIGNKSVGTIPAGEFKSATIGWTYRGAYKEHDINVRITYFDSKNIVYEFPKTQAEIAESHKVLGTSIDIINKFRWWNVTWNYRVPVIIDNYQVAEMGAVNRTNFPVEYKVNFTYIFRDIGYNGTFDDKSIRIVEYAKNGTMLEFKPVNYEYTTDANMDYKLDLDDKLQVYVQDSYWNDNPSKKYENPSQFDPDPEYNAKTNAIGTVVWILNGITPAGGSRYYFLYFNDREHGIKDEPNYKTDLKCGIAESRYYTFNNSEYSITADKNKGGVLRKVTDRRGTNYELDWDTWLIKELTDGVDGGVYKDYAQTSPTIEFKAGAVKSTYAVRGKMRSGLEDHPTIEYIFNVTFYSQTGLIKVHDGYISSENRRVERIYYAGEFYAGGEKVTTVTQVGNEITAQSVNHRNYYFDYISYYDSKTNSTKTTNVIYGLNSWLTTTPGYHPAKWMSIYRSKGDAVARLWISDYKNWTFTEWEYSRDMTSSPPHPTPGVSITKGGPHFPPVTIKINSWYTAEIYPYFAQSSGADIYRVLPKNTEVAADYYFWIHKGDNSSAEEVKSVSEAYTVVTKPMTIGNYSASPIYKITIKGVEEETIQAISVDPSSVVPYKLSIEVTDYRNYNPGFEINNSGYVSQDSSPQDKIFSWDSTKKHSGDYAVKITDDDNTGKGMWYTDPLIPAIVSGNNYTISAWVYLEGNGTGGAFLTGEWYYGSGIEEKNRTKNGITSTVVNTTGQWIKLTATGTAPKGATDLRLNLTVENWNGSVWFDDLEVDRRTIKDCVVINPNIADQPPSNDDVSARNGYAHLPSDRINTFYDQNTSIGHGDSKSLQILSYDGSKAVWYTMPHISKLLPGRNYTMSAWVYLVDGGSGAGGAYIYGEWYNGSKAENYTGFAGKSDTANTSGQWILLTSYVMAPPNATELRMNLAIENWVGKVLFDDLSVKVLDDNETINISIPTIPNNWNISVRYNEMEILKNGTPIMNVTFYNIENSDVALLITAPQSGDNNTVNATVNFTLNSLNLTRSYNFRLFVDIRYGVNLSAENVVRFVRKGDNTTFAVTVINAGNVNDTYNITPAQVVQKEGWIVKADRSNITLAPGESDIVNITVTPPLNIPPDDEMIIDAIAQSMKSNSTVKRISVIVYGNTMKNISVVCIDNIHYAYPGNKTNYTIYVVNNGYKGDTITFDDLITSPGWNATLDKMSVTLGNESGNNSATFTLEVALPANYSLAKAGFEERTFVIGKSTLMKGLRDIAYVSTIVNQVYDIRIINVTNNTKPNVNTTVNYSIAIRNAGNGEDSVNVTVWIPHLLRDYTGLDKDFSEYIPQVKIAQDEIKPVNFSVWIPPWTAAGTYKGIVNVSNGHPGNITHPEDNYTFNITIKRSYTAVITANRYTDEENKIIDFNRTPSQSIELPDSSTTITITNKGNGPDNISVKVMDYPEWVTFDENSSYLGPGGSKVLGMKINVPETAVAGTYNITVLCWSANDNIVNASFITFRVNVQFVDLLLPSDGVTIPQKISTGDVVEITAKVVNNGTIEAVDIWVLLIDNGKVLDNVTIGKVSSNGSSDANFIWKAQDGTHNIQVKVNPDNLPRESNTTNNNFASSVFVAGTTYLWWVFPLMLLSVIIILLVYITWKKRSKEEEF